MTMNGNDGGLNNGNDCDNNFLLQDMSNTSIFLESNEERE